jgi:hypothetical protein
MIFFGSIFRKTLLLIILFDLISFFGYLSPVINSITFIVLLIAFLIISLKRLDLGLYILLAELFVGSKGYLFFLDLNGKNISIRIAFWLVLMLVWLFKAGFYLFKNKKNIIVQYQNKSLEYLRFFKSPLSKTFLILFIIFGLSLLNGFIKNNGAGNVFNDFNAYLFFGLIFVMYDVITKKEQVAEIVQVMTGSLIAMSLKTLSILYLFSHKFFGIYYLYKWVRTSGVGEITNMGGDYYRIFFQSHIYTTIGFVLVLVFFLLDKNIILSLNFKKTIRDKKLITLLSLLILFCSVILVSLSRSFWLGLIVCLASFFAYYCFIEKFVYKKIITFFSVLILLFLFGMGLVNNIIKFPIPSGGSNVSFSDIMGDRATNISGESAVGSRWSLLKPLWSAIANFPTILVGDGFGKTVTYISSDPRILEKDPTGKYTTYAFEWGYLDFWLKFGIIGLGVYLILLLKIFLSGWNLLKINKYQIVSDQDRLVLGLLLGLILLVAVHGFTPYLNHPLGIGYLLICVIIFERNSLSSRVER